MRTGDTHIVIVSAVEAEGQPTCTAVTLLCVNAILDIASNAMYFLLVAVMTTAVAADTSKYCSLCRPGTSSGDRAHHTVCLYQAS